MPTDTNESGVGVFAPDTTVPTKPQTKVSKKHDPATIKFAEILYYEGRTIKEISRLTGLPERIVNYYAYQSKPAWSHIKEEIITLRRSKSISNIVEAANNYANVLRESSQRLVREVIEEGKDLKLHEQKTVSDMLISQVRATQIIQNDPTMPQSQTNIQINLTKEEAEGVLENDPAKEIETDNG